MIRRVEGLDARLEDAGSKSAWWHTPYVPVGTPRNPETGSVRIARNRADRAILVMGRVGTDESALGVAEPSEFYRGAQYTRTQSDLSLRGG